MLRDCDIRELQADELCTFIRQQEQTHVAVCDQVDSNFMGPDSATKMEISVKT